MMIAHSLDSGWKRFLDRFRKLWQVPPQHDRGHILPPCPVNTRNSAKAFP
jgi:hypothetical protein